VQFGYLTEDAYLVTVDTLGFRALFKAIRINPQGAMQFLGRDVPMEGLGPVSVSAMLHRKGWRDPGEAVLKRTRAHLFRTATGHVIVGSTWQTLRPLRWRSASVTHPYPWVFDPIPSRRGGGKPPPRSPCVLLIPDASVKACRIRGPVVELLAVERKELTDFILGKVTVRISFPSEEAARRFASDFPRVEDPADVDAGVREDVDRSKKLVWSWKLLARASPFTVSLAISLGLTLFALAFLGPLSALRISSILGGVGIATWLYLPNHVREHRREAVDHRRKWPRVLVERWVRDVDGYAAEFWRNLRDAGVTLDPLGDLGPLDGYLRSLPPDTVFGQHAWGAAALVGTYFLARLGRPIDYEWTWWEDYGTPVLRFPSIEYLFAPFTTVIKVWKRKERKTLDETVADVSRTVLRYAAFQSTAQKFAALGFFDKGWEDIDPFLEGFFAEVERIPPEPWPLGEDRCLQRTLSYGPFRVRYIEREVPGTSRAIPIFAIPSYPEAPSMRASVEAMGWEGGVPQDVLVVRVEGHELLPLGVQVANILETAPHLAEGASRVLVRLAAIADHAQMVTPRMRASRPEVTDAIAPTASTELGVPTVPYANLLGRIVSVEELGNALRGTPLWRLELDITGLRLPLLVRKDRCEGMPEVGHHASASVWLVAEVEAEEHTPPGYIR